MELASGAADGMRIEKASLHDQVATRIRDMIVEGVLAPGSRIDEAALVDRLGVSRTPFREALRTLAAEGLVEIRPTRGSIVRKLSREDVHAMLEVLAQLERLAAELACARASDAEIANILDMHARMLDCYQRRDRMPYFKLNQDIHKGIVEAAHNPVLREMHGKLHAHLKRIRFIGNETPDYWAAAVAEHEEMAQALRRRDAAALGEVAARHILNTWQRVVNAV
jgi:DNA-binding GntR family transcriptional regulator